MVEPKRRLRAYLTAALGLIVALVVGGGGLFVLCDPGPAYWSTIASVLGATAVLCGWAAVTARPRRAGVWLPPVLSGAFLLLLASLAIANFAGQRGGAALTEGCREGPSIGPAASPVR